MQPITVLRLGSSLDFSGDLPDGTRAWQVAERMLAEASGQPVKTVVKPVWPSPQVPKLLERWLEEHQPDIVLVVISSYWVETEVVGVRVRKLGLVGRKLEAASRQAADKPVVAASRPYLWGRKLLLRTVGGSTNFTPAEMEAQVESWLRVVLRKESAAPAVVGTPFSPDTMASSGARRRATARKDELRERLRAACERLNVYWDMPPHAPDAFDSSLRLADRVHFNELAHARMGEIDGRALVETWQRMRGER